MQQLLLIDKMIKEYDVFLNSLSNTTKLIESYDNIDESYDINININRIGIIFHGSSDIPAFFDINKLTKLCIKFNLKNLDFIACEINNYSKWRELFTSLETNTNTIIGYTDKMVGNMGTWIIGNTDISKIYFNDKLLFYYLILL